MAKPSEALQTEVKRPTALSPFQSLQDEMERMFHAFSLPEMGWRTGMQRREGALGLRINVSESDDEIQVTADLPGVSEEDIAVTLENDVLRISAEKSADSEEKDKTWHVVERSYGRFERAIRMPSGIDPDAVKASFKDGVLSVRLPKPPEAEPPKRKIAVTHE